MNLSLRSLRTVAVAAIVVGTGVAVAPVANAAPPNIPSPSQAQSMLDGLTVAPEGSSSGYEREKFPHWSTQSGNCDTRDTVLARDGRGVQVDSSCNQTAGTWFSPYDGATWSAASDVDIDHVVPLAEAWRSGASSWSTTERQRFANDLSNPQLIAVTDNVNQSKGDQSPDQWKPPSQGYWCTYASMWVAVKSGYDLTATSAEVGALDQMLGTC